MTSTNELIRFLSLGVAIFAIASLIIAFTVGRSCIRSASEASIADEIQDIPSAFNMTAFQLMKEYSRAYDFANATYNGTVGVVEGQTCINENENYFSLYEGTHWRVRCFASDEEINKVKVLTRLDHRSPEVDVPRFASWYAPIFAFKGRVEGVNDKYLNLDLRGCTLQDPP